MKRSAQIPAGNLAAQLVPVFAALADRTRLRLINLMRDREVCVCYFVEILGLTQPKISRHLAYLRRSSLVLARREGKWMHYRIDPSLDPAVRRIVDRALEALHGERQFQRDLEKLAKACCQPQRLVALQGAPTPAALSGSPAGSSRK
ncbi:MAG TPA: metalloregulator ArsR/SmtB family transcription factor [Acidobacteriaceae bacterium]|nr:metalloregulator ArsR/SmtB family transcription factor [Acidobacteriaceae bacterium]